MSDFIFPNMLDTATKGFEAGRVARIAQARDGILSKYGSDPAKAQGLLAQSGDLEGAKSMQDMRTNDQAYRTTEQENLMKVRAGKVQVMQNLYEGLRRVPAGQRRDALENAIIPFLGDMGIDDQGIEYFRGLREEQLTDENLKAFSIAMGQKAKEYQLANGEDGYLGSFDKENGSLRTLREPDANQYQTLKNADGSETLVRVPKSGGGQGLLAPFGDGDGARPGLLSPPSIGGNNAAGRGGFDAIYDGFVAPQEGGYTASDGNGAPANFGINQKANPDVDVANLTPGAAREIYKQRYWNASGAANLPPALQAVHFDTAVNMGVGAAQNLLQQSGGDPQRYLQLREQRYRAIAQANPERAGALPTWLRRNQALGQFIGAGGSGGGGDGVRAVFTSKGFPGGVDPKQARQDDKEARDGRKEETAFRQKFNADPEVKKYQVIASAYNTVKDLSKRPSAANDIALIFSYMRMLDPDSVVREGEFATAQNAASIPDRVRNAYNKAVNGERLNDSQRAQFAASAKQVHATSRQRYEEMVNEYRGYASEYGYSDNAVPYRPNPDAAPKVTANMNPAQRAAYRQAFKPGAPYGSEDNPLIVNSEAAYNNLKSGTFYISPDGQRRRKGG